MKTYNKLTSFAAAAFVLAGTSLSAATVLVDLSTANTITNPEDGFYWNSIGSGTNTTSTITGLLDSTNTATSFNLSITPTSVNSGGVSGSGFGGTAIAGPNGATEPFIDTDATLDGLFVNNNADGTALFSFTNLVASTPYDFSVIGGRASNGKDGGIKILTGSADAFAVDLDIIESDDLLDSYSLLNDGTILNFTVTSNASGEIDFEFFKGDTTNGTSGGSTINAFSIDGPVPVPEPSAFALLAGMFGLTWVMLRRRA